MRTQTLSDCEKFSLTTRPPIHLPNMLENGKKDVSRRKQNWICNVSAAIRLLIRTTLISYFHQHFAGVEIRYTLVQGLERNHIYSKGHSFISFLQAIYPDAREMRCLQEILERKKKSGPLRKFVEGKFHNLILFPSRSQLYRPDDVQVGILAKQKSNINWSRPFLSK